MVVRWVCGAVEVIKARTGNGGALVIWEGYGVNRGMRSCHGLMVHCGFVLD